jgi:hypothetical protein
MTNFDYKKKYLKYKYKYNELLKQQKIGKQYGGTETIVPDKLPQTYSFLFMPLIYYALDKTSVIMIDEFESLVNECIENTINMLGMDSLPFNNFEDFIVYLNFILNSNGIKTTEDILKLCDVDHHIPGMRQEIITNYHSDEAVNMIISCLANMLVERHTGKKFIYLK